jgi:hypothetical protein
MPLNEVIDYGTKRIGRLAQKFQNLMSNRSREDFNVGVHDLTSVLQAVRDSVGRAYTNLLSRFL